MQLDKLAKDAILFVVDENDVLLGSLTDGDVRRGLIREESVNQPVINIVQKDPKYIRQGENNIQKLIEYRNRLFKIIPVLNQTDKVVDIINFSQMRSYLQVDAVIMAGGRGQRLAPLTDSVPKPLLKVGDKPIIEHCLDRLALFGIYNFWISVHYLGKQVESYFGDGSQKKINIKYVWEDKPLGTLGSVSSISDFQNEYILITNSDLLTNINYEDFFLTFLQENADLAVATIPYNVNIPYAVLETDDDNKVFKLKEKPTYTYYSNAGIYLVKKSALQLLPHQEYFNATDLIEKLIKNNAKVLSYKLFGYWMYIGRHEDFQKAQEEIKNIQF